MNTSCRPRGGIVEDADETLNGDLFSTVKETADLRLGFSIVNDCVDVSNIGQNPKSRASGIQAVTLVGPSILNYKGL